MIETHKNLGYEYTVSLCEAINKFAEQEEMKNPSVFIYRGSNLRFALERALYFNYANSKYFFNIFTTCYTGNKSKDISVKNNTEKKIISFLCAIEEKDISIGKIKLTEILKNIMRYIVQYFIICFGIDKIAKHIRYSINRNKRKDIHPEILFCVQNARIVNYLTPISSKISSDIYVYITYDKKTADYLKDKNLPYIYLSKFGYLFERLAKKKNDLYKLVITDKYDLLFDSIKMINPKSIVVEEGTTAHDEIISGICKQCNIQSICIQQGWAFFPAHIGLRNMTYNKMLVWGDGFANNLSLYNPYQRFITVGNHMINTKDFKMKTIQIISLFFQGKTFIISEEIWQTFIKLAEQITLECKGVKVLIREHPLYLLSTTEKDMLEKKGIMFMPSSKYSLDQVFEKSDLTISIFSSTIFESMAAGIVPIIFNPNLFPKYFPDINAMGACIEVKSIRDTISIIKKLINNPKEIEKYKEPVKKIRKEYFAYDKDTAIDNIIKEITS